LSAPWLRLGAALGLSALLHGVVLLLMRAPSPPPGGDFQMNVLIVPLRPAVPPASSAAAAVPKSAVQKEPGKKSQAMAVAPARPSPAEPNAGRRVSASISTGPISPPAQPPQSKLTDAASYLDTTRLRTWPELAAPLVARYPRQAFEQRRSAVVILQMMIDESGAVAEALPLPGPASEFVEAALEALSRTRFQPAEGPAGKPARSRVYFAVSFVLE
jgi:TonB family protein